MNKLLQKIDTDDAVAASVIGAAIVLHALVSSGNMTLGPREAAKMAFDIADAFIAEATARHVK